jgi:hypothetical protein
MNRDRPRRTSIVAVMVAACLLVATTTTQAAQCVSHADCPTSQMCDNGYCVPSTSYQPSNSGGGTMNPIMLVLGVGLLVMVVVVISANSQTPQYGWQQVMPPLDRHQARPKAPMLGWTIPF